MILESFDHYLISLNSHHWDKSSRPDKAISRRKSCIEERRSYVKFFEWRIIKIMINYLSLVIFKLDIIANNLRIFIKHIDYFIKSSVLSDF